MEIERYTKHEPYPGYGKLAQTVRVRDGQHIFPAAQRLQAGYQVYPPDGIVYILASGEIHAFIGEPRGSIAVRACTYERPGSIIGYEQLFAEADVQTPDKFISPRNNTLVHTIGTEDVRTLLDESPEFAAMCLASLNDSLHETTESMAAQTELSVRGRVLQFLQDHHQAQVLRLSHREIADMIGTYRETVSMYLRTLAEEGLVTLRYKQIVINPDIVYEDPYSLRK